MPSDFGQTAAFGQTATFGQSTGFGQPPYNGFATSRWPNSFSTAGSMPDSQFRPDVAEREPEHRQFRPVANRSMDTTAAGPGSDPGAHANVDARSRPTTPRSGFDAAPNASCNGRRSGASARM